MEECCTRKGIIKIESEKIRLRIVRHNTNNEIFNPLDTGYFFSYCQPITCHIGAFCFDARQFGAFHFGDFHFDALSTKTKRRAVGPMSKTMPAHQL